MGIFQTLKAANSAVSCRIWQKFDLLRARLHVIITCKHEKDRIKTVEKKWQRRFFSIITLSVAREPVVESGQISNSSKLL